MDYTIESEIKVQIIIREIQKEEDEGDSSVISNNNLAPNNNQSQIKEDENEINFKHKQYKFT